MRNRSGNYNFETNEGTRIAAADNNTPGSQPSRNKELSLNKDLQLDAFRSSPLKMGKTEQNSPKGLKTPSAKPVLNLNQTGHQKGSPTITASQSISLLKKQQKSCNTPNEEGGGGSVLPHIYNNLPLAEITQSDEPSIARNAVPINEDSEREQEPEFTYSPDVKGHRELRSMFVQKESVKKRIFGVKNNSAISVENHLNCMRRNLDQHASDQSKQVQLNLSIYDGYQGFPSTQYGTFKQIRNSTSMGLWKAQGSNEMNTSNTTKAFTNHNKGISTYNSAMFNTTDDKNTEPISDAMQDTHYYRSSHNATTLEQRLPSLKHNIRGQSLMASNSMSLKSKKIQMQMKQNRKEQH